MRMTILTLLISIASFGQELGFAELGSHPSLCRTTNFQNGGGIVFATGSGGSSPYAYQWEYLITGETFSSATWNGRNPGIYKITITDAIGAEVTDTIFLDSLNVIANFHAFSDDLMELPGGGYIGFAPDTIGFVNLSEHLSVPHIPDAASTFFWNFDHPTLGWNIDFSGATQYKGYLGGGEYTVCLTAKNSNGCVDTTCKNIGLFGSLTSVEENGNSDYFAVRPSFSSNSIIVHASSTTQTVLNVYSTSGKLILEHKINESQKQLPFNFPKGIYFYAFTTENGKQLTNGKFNH